MKDAWEKIVDRSGGKVRSDGLKVATWRFANFVLGRPYSIVISMVKARGLGWWGSARGGAYKETFGEPFEKGVVSKPGAVSGSWLGGNFWRMCTLDAFCSQKCYIV